MIKVPINGTPIYKLCFSRRKYKTVKKKNLTAGQIITKLKAANTAKLYSLADIEAALRAVFESKPLYETAALIYIHDAKAGEPPVATASTRQSKLDDNSRNTGREVALGRLLNLKRADGESVFSEIERRAIRTAYDARLNKPSPKPRTPSGASGAPARVINIDTRRKTELPKPALVLRSA